MGAVHAGLGEVADGTFAGEVLEADGPVLVQFTAEWCPSCRMLGPVLAKMAGEREGELKVVAIDVDRNPGTTLTYGVMAVPALLLFKDGEVVHQSVGARSKAKLERDLAGHL